MRTIAGLLILASLLMVGGSAQARGVRPVVFSTSRTGNHDLFFVKSNGHGLSQLTTSTDDDDFPALSADGATVVWAGGPLGQRDIFARPLAGGSVTPLTNDTALDQYPAISPSGTTVAYVKDGIGMPTHRAIETVPLAGGTSQLLASDANADLIQPTWSPDGGSVAFTKVSGGFNIYTVGAGGGVPQLAISDGQDPTYCDDNHIVFVRQTGGTDLMLWNGADPTHPKLLADSSKNRDGFTPSCSPDGKKLVFTSNRSGGQAVYIASIDLVVGKLGKWVKLSHGDGNSPTIGPVL